MLEEIRLHALGRKQAARSHDATQSRSDAQYPFPVAFCRRSMLLETSPHRRWEKMIDLAELVMKYVTIGAIASAKSEQKKRPFIARLTRSKGPSMRDWYECCFAALDPHAKDACSEFCLRHARSIPEKTLERAHGECSILVKDRNQSRGHGHIMEELAYQGLCSKHTRTIDSLLGILDAFSECELLKPQDLRCRERITKFSAQVLMGSHPLFAIREYTVQTGIDTDCILHDRERNEFISLYPWIHLEHCEACMRPMMFIFHRYAPGNLELLEYPNNHSKSWKEDIAE
jgi:ribosomal protein L13E